MNKNKILEQFHYFNIQADVDSVYGNWAVSTDGDVVNYLYPYAILAIHFKDADWMAKMKTKVWFKPECEEALNMALNRAKKIIIQFYERNSISRRVGNSPLPHYQGCE